MNLIQQPIAQKLYIIEAEAENNLPIEPDNLLSLLETTTTGNYQVNEYENKLRWCNKFFMVGIKVNQDTHEIIINPKTQKPLLIKKVEYCKSRLCDHNPCIEFRIMQNIRKLEPHYDPITTVCHITLTIPNVPKCELTKDKEKAIKRLFTNYRLKIAPYDKYNGVYCMEFKYIPHSDTYHIHWHMQLLGNSYRDYPLGTTIRNEWTKRVKKYLGPVVYKKYTSRMKKGKVPGIISVTYNFKEKDPITKAWRNLNKKSSTKKKYKLMNYMAKRASTVGLIHYDDKNKTNHVKMDTDEFLKLVKGSRILNFFGKETIATLVRSELSKEKKEKKHEFIRIYGAPNPKQLKDPPDNILEEAQKAIETNELIQNINGTYYYDVDRDLILAKNTIDITNYMTKPEKTIVSSTGKKLTKLPACRDETKQTKLPGKYPKVTNENYGFEKYYNMLRRNHEI